MSHLYSMFAKDVSKYCKTNANPSSITKCKHDLLTFGVTKLEKMEDSHLDAMDPFQRSANDISKYSFHFISFIIIRVSSARLDYRELSRNKHSCRVMPWQAQST